MSKEVMWGVGEADAKLKTYITATIIVTTFFPGSEFNTQFTRYLEYTHIYLCDSKKNTKTKRDYGEERGVEGCGPIHLIQRGIGSFQSGWIKMLAQRTQC